MADDDVEYTASFDGPCTCDHEIADHGWGSCGVVLEDETECTCEGGWTE